MSMIRRTYSMLTWGQSTITSNAFYVGDGESLSVSLITTTTASTYTLQGSNADGFTAAIPAHTWSTMTALTAQGIYAVQPGAAWVRILQAASTSSASVTLAKQIGYV